MAIFLAVFVVDIAITSWLFTQLRSRLSIFQKKLFYAIVFSWPFLLIRLIYSAIGDFTENSRFTILEGDPTIYLCMDVLEEIVAVSICVAFGTSAVLQLKPKKRGLPGQAGTDLMAGEVAVGYGVRLRVFGVLATRRFSSILSLDSKCVHPIDKGVSTELALSWKE